MNESVYLERYSYGPRLIETPPSADLEIVVVIPCYFEPDLISTLQSLSDCTPIAGKIEVLVVVNHSVSDSNQVKNQNQHSIKTANQWITTQTSDLSFYILEQTFPEKHAGVGLARKAGMDEAVRRFEQLRSDGIIACLDADCTCSPNYFQALDTHFQNHQTPGCSIYFEHATEGPLPSKVYQAITAYELHLRYYTHGLKFCGLPCAFQTVGSSMAVRSSAYQKQGGMNKRKAGEDFYFLQKIIKLGGFTELNTTTVFPSSRPSTRVPFGTGKAINKATSRAQAEPPTYHYNTFMDLKYLVAEVDQLFHASHSSIRAIWESLSVSLQHFISNEKFTDFIKDLNEKTNTRDSFKRRFFNWCDGFFAFKYANYAREFHYPGLTVVEAASWLLKEAYGLEPASDDLKELLEQYRLLDKKSSNTKN